MPGRERQASILVVDDKLEMAETLADGLTDLGYRARAIGSRAPSIAPSPTASS